ncbi:MAG: protease Lon-related BREX system protein BrxL [Athalassotoga sp.]|uniref:protease Lon-related BREX system protein BrxL n=1 Tax=Athalassotoga sp. TaxID=2022597 RepID=UPI003D018DAA
MEIDALDSKAIEFYPDYVIEKSIVRKIKIGYNVPTYVLEHLLGNYGDPSSEKGIENVKKILSEHYLRSDMAEYMKSQIREKGQFRIIDRISTKLDVNENEYVADLQNLSVRNGIISDRLVIEHPKMLYGGMWAIIDLRYDFENHPGRPFIVEEIHPIQLSNFTKDDFVSKRSNFTLDEWIDLIIRSIGLEPTKMTRREKFLQILRLVPLAEKNYNLVELGPRATGKSFIYREISPYAILISGGNTTVAQLFYNLTLRKTGLIGEWDVVAFDEVAGINFKDKSALQMLKDYMESGSFARKVEIVAEASMVFNGNINDDVQTLLKLSTLFEPFPIEMQDTALMDRIHAYLPGWEIKKLSSDILTNHFGFAIDYFSEVLRSLRQVSLVNDIEQYFNLGSQLNSRDEKAVKKTCSGMIKILFPDGNYTKENIEEILTLSIEMRRRVKEQLKKMGGLEFWNTEFSYIDKETRVEKYVSVPEGGTNVMISQDPLPPGTVYTVSMADGKANLVKIEAVVTQGEGKISSSGGDPEFKESVKTVKTYLESQEKKLMPQSVKLRDYNITVQVTPMMGNAIGEDVSIAVFVAILSAIHRSTMKKGFAVIGEMTITGALKTTSSFVDRLKMLSENGAKTVAIPIEYFPNLVSSLGSLENIIPIPIAKPEDAFLKGRLEE